MGPEGGLAGPAGVPAADHPEGDPLAEPHELTLYAAFLAGIHLEVHFIFGGFAVQHLILRQVKDVVWHFRHVVLFQWQYLRHIYGLANEMQVYLQVE